MTCLRQLQSPAVEHPVCRVRGQSQRSMTAMSAVTSLSPRLIVTITVRGELLTPTVTFKSREGDIVLGVKQGGEGASVNGAVDRSDV